MKGKKLLAGVLSAAMVLGTMVMPAFASSTSVSSDDEFKQAVEQNKGDIVLSADVSYDRQGQRSTIADGSTIDLNGKQLTLTGYGYEFKNTTIKNGKIIISGNNQGNGIFSDYVGYTLTFDNVELTADNLGGPYLMSSNFGNGRFILTNGTMFNVTGVSEPNKFYAMQSMGSLEVLNGSKITFTGPERGIVNANVKVDASSELDFTTGLEGLYLGEKNTYEADENAQINATTHAAAKINKAFYGSLDTALEAAQAGDTITLLADTSIGDFNFYNNIDLNNKTLTLTGDRYDLNTSGIDVTIKNGTIIVKDTESSTNGHDALFNLFGDTDNKRETLTFDNVKFYCEDGYRHWDYPAGYLFAVANGTTFKAINDTEFHVKDVVACAVFCNNAPNLGVIEFDDATIEIENTDTAFLHAMSFKDSTVTLKNVEDGLKNGTNNTKFVVDNTTITATGGECGAKLYSDTSIEFINGSTFTANKILLKNDTATVINENDNSTINAEIITETVTGPVADTVKVAYEDVTENEGEAVYDIYVIAEENTINRLMSVQMALKLTTEDAIEMTVNAADGLTSSFENGMYLFNFDGETRPSATGTKIKIGQVKFVGYGTFNLSINEDEDNKVHAAELNGENVVTDFIVGGSRLGKGDFDISASLEDRIEVPTRELTINIAFPNTVEENVVAYQDMSVKIGDETIALGDGGVGMEDGKYVITKELVYNTPYTVEVSGGGYRTARYTVTMNEDKILNFWNNVKDIPEVVEVGKESSKKNVTFLAGELVKDGKINIYDLSAVVSYFGTINDVTKESEYAKYDLNRDGKIDSKDVAYVLVSWGK